MTRKEGDPHTRRVDWPTRKDKRAGNRKEGQAGAGVHTLGATKNPAGVNLRGLAGVSGLPTVTSEGGQNEKEGEQQAEG